MVSWLIHPQLPLGLEPGERLNFDTFVAGDNTLAAGITRQCAVGEGEQQIYLWSKPGLGKSHLLQASCNIAAKNQRTVCYLTSQHMLQQPVEMFDGLEQLNLICLDELERWVNTASWQEALFNLINRVRDAGNSLIMASTTAPESSDIALADLRSRLGWGPVFQLRSLSDADKYQAMKIRARLSGLDLPQNVADYLLRRYPRDLTDLFERLSVLDKAAMSMQRPLTIPLIKTVFPET